MKRSVNNHNNNPFHSDLIIIFDELKEYIIHNPKYNVLNVISYVISNILSKKYVHIWHKIISLSLDILIILLDHYTLSSILISCCSILSKLTFENTENINQVLNYHSINHILNIIKSYYINE